MSHNGLLVAGKPVDGLLATQLHLVILSHIPMGREGIVHQALYVAIGHFQVNFLIGYHDPGFAALAVYQDIERPAVLFQVQPVLMIQQENLAGFDLASQSYDHIGGKGCSKTISRNRQDEKKSDKNERQPNIEIMFCHRDLPGHADADPKGVIHNFDCGIPAAVIKRRPLSIDL